MCGMDVSEAKDVGGHQGHRLCHDCWSRVLRTGGEVLEDGGRFLKAFKCPVPSCPNTMSARLVCKEVGHDEAKEIFKAALRRSQGLRDSLLEDFDSWLTGMHIGKQGSSPRAETR